MVLFVCDSHVFPVQSAKVALLRLLGAPHTTKDVEMNQFSCLALLCSNQKQVRAVIVLHCLLSVVSMYSMGQFNVRM